MQGMKETIIQGTRVWSTTNKVVETDKGEKGVGRYVSQNKEGTLGEWIAYNERGEGLEGEVVSWK